MSKIYVTCWVRFTTETLTTVNKLVQKYRQYDAPEPLILEGNGVQCVYAFKTTDFHDILTEIKLDGNETTELSPYEYTIYDNPRDYHVAMQYCIDPTFFIEKNTHELYSE